MERNLLQREIGSLAAYDDFMPPIVPPILAGVDVARRMQWMSDQAKKKTFHPQEPAFNADRFPIPPWLNKNNFFRQFEQEYGTEATAIIGQRGDPVVARYFVIHDTDTTNDVPTPERVPNRARGIHLWLGIRSVLLARDWAQKGLGTKLENGVRNRCFVHTELTRHSSKIAAVDKIKAAGTLYTFRQYRLLAYAYVVCSLRKEQFLTVTIHREVDRAVRIRKNDGTYDYGHDDPQKFDMNYFYGQVRSLTGMPNATFGIQPERVAYDKERNMGEYVNEFIPYGKGLVESANQYGTPRRNPARAPSHHVPGKFVAKSDDIRLLEAVAATVAGTVRRGAAALNPAWSLLDLPIAVATGTKDREYDQENNLEGPYDSFMSIPPSVTFLMVARQWGTREDLGQAIQYFVDLSLPTLKGKTFKGMTKAEQKQFKEKWLEYRQAFEQSRREVVAEGLIPPLDGPRIPFGFLPDRYRSFSGLKSDAGLWRIESTDRVLHRLAKAGKITLTQKELDVFQRISQVESSGKIQTLNAYDGGVISLGFMQFTIHVGKLQQWIKLAPAAFKRYGIELDGTLTYVFGKNGTFAAIKGVPQSRIDELRYGGWAERFFFAGLDEEIIIAGVGLARSYLQTHLDDLKARLKSHYKDTTSYSEFISRFYDKSGYMKALFQESHNNNPSNSTRAVRAAVKKATDDKVSEYDKLLKIYQDALLGADPDWSRLISETAVGTSLTL